MSNTHGVSNLPAYQAPTFSEATGVLSQIQSQIGNVQNLFASVQQLLAEIAALQPPDIKAYTDGKGNVNVQAYNAAVTSFQNQLNNLNRRLEDAYRKLGQGQALLQRLQSSDLPTAQRRDAQRLEKAMKDAQEVLNSAAKAISDSSKSEVEGRSSSQEETHVELRVREKKVAIRLDRDPTFKDVIHAFAIMAVVVGQGSPERKFTGVPKTPGSGIPPLGLP